ncbi:membrane protein [Microbacterium phage Araxxi]|uniref:Membrane protein n=1 Tax=Microbacterium phage Araxxi TaxID=2590948 RepID=A0A516KT52_9CAUD|nr:membrane protein [Microbacterium phage Araxxi]QDP44856.1 membrane protein [Microbacterium phage Araxxi]USH45484.1 membrane protein [Microbacterium phage DoTi]
MSDFNTPSVNEDLETRAGLIKRSRKAIVAGVVAVAGSFGPAFLAISGDGVITGEEIAFTTVAALGFGVAALCATWATPNAN